MGASAKVSILGQPPRNYKRPSVSAENYFNHIFNCTDSENIHLGVSGPTTTLNVPVGC